MRIRYAIIMLVLVCGIVGWLQAENPTTESIAAAKKSEPAKAPERSINSEEPMSIFGPEVRKFKFRIDDTLVTNEVARAFTVTYDVPDNPPILGAYPDTETNALVVIAPAEAEPAIRRSLATRFAEIMGHGNPAMAIEKRELLNQRNVNLNSILGLELALVEAEFGNDEKDIQAIQDRLKQLERELSMTEKKIQVVSKYLKRLNEIPE